jgi:hypothetical protein
MNMKYDIFTCASLILTQKRRRTGPITAEPRKTRGHKKKARKEAQWRQGLAAALRRELTRHWCRLHSRQRDRQLNRQRQAIARRWQNHDY